MQTIGLGMTIYTGNFSQDYFHYKLSKAFTSIMSHITSLVSKFRCNCLQFCLASPNFPSYFQAREEVHQKDAVHCQDTTALESKIYVVLNEIISCINQSNLSTVK